MARISHHWKTYTSWFVFENTDILWEKMVIETFMNTSLDTDFQRENEMI